jgi:hypothetical protein
MIKYLTVGARAGVGQGQSPLGEGGGHQHEHQGALTYHFCLQHKQKTTRLASLFLVSQHAVEFFASIRKQKLCAPRVWGIQQAERLAAIETVHFSPVIMTNDNVCAACPSRFSHAVWPCAKY